MPESKTSFTIGAQGYRSGMLYWGVVAVVVGIFLVTTISYWSGTISILEQTSVVSVEVHRAPKATQ